jgi:hypothetical protein
VSKVAAGIAMGEIQTAIGDIGTITDIMVMVDEHVPHEEIHREWVVLFGRAINQITQRIEDIMGTVA